MTTDEPADDAPREPASLLSEQELATLDPETAKTLAANRLLVRMGLMSPAEAGEDPEE